MAKKKVTKKVVIKVEQVETVRKNELAEFRKGIPAAISQTAIVVDSPESETLAAEAVGTAKDMIKDAEKRRLKITKPLDLSKKETMSLFSDIVKPLVEFVAVLTPRIVNYRLEQERIADEAEEERLAEEQRLEDERVTAEAKAEKFKSKRAVDKALETVDELDEQIAVVRETEYVPNVGSATVAKVWTYNIDVEEDVPREYCSPDRGKLRAAVRAGERDIKGVSVYQSSNLRS